jgi:hypothetical protein
MFETLLLTAVVPAALDLIKGSGQAIGRKWFGLSVDDQIKLDNANVERVKALAELDNPYGTPSQWIVDLRASFRYIAAGILIVAGIGIMGVGAYQYLFPSEAITLAGDDTKELAKSIIILGAETAGTPFSFIFGERMWTGIKGMMK